MNREEEIIETAKFIYEPCIPQSLQMKAGFIDGATWADKTMLARIREWLENHDMTEHICVICSGTCSISFDNRGLIDVLYKAMKE